MMIFSSLEILTGIILIGGLVAALVDGVRRDRESRRVQKETGHLRFRLEKKA